VVGTGLVERLKFWSLGSEAQDRAPLDPGSEILGFRV